MSSSNILFPPLRNPIEKQFEHVTRYHKYFFLVYFITKLSTTWHTLNIMFLAPPVPYTCGSEPTWTNLTEAKESPCPCSTPVWDHSLFTKTVQMKYVIVCEQRWLVNMSESVMFLGLILGALIFGIMADRYGRLMMYAVCQLIVGASGCLLVIMPTIFFFTIIRFFEGIGAGGAFVTGYVLCVEFCGAKYRATVSSFLQHFPSNLGLLCLAGLSYLLKDCDHFQLSISIPILIFATVKCLLLESPIWLLDSNKKEEAIIIMEKFCRFNNKSSETIRADIEAYYSSLTTIEVEPMKFYEIFKYKSHGRTFCCMLYLYFVCGMGYYGVSQFIGRMSVHVHRNITINGSFLLLGTICALFLINKLGRRLFFRLTTLIAGLFMFVVVFIPKKFKPSWIRVMFACFASTFFYVSFIIVLLYGVELFPTHIRNSVLGVLSVTSRIGQMLGPQVNSLPGTIAGTIFATLALTSSIVTFLLPETKGSELPSNLEEKYNQSQLQIQSTTQVVTRPKM